MSQNQSPITFLRLPSAPKRKRLLFIRSGETSAHTAWFKQDVARSWDLMICYHCPSGPKAEDFADISFIGCKSKFHAIYTISQYSSLFDGYEAFGFMDDDIECTFEDVDRIFELMDRLDIGLCQPALSHDSFHSWEITLFNPAFLARHTNFVEIMVPFFRRDAFELCRKSFSESVSGFGLDFLWPKLLSDKGIASAIMDAVPVRHARATDRFGGAFYNHLKKMGIDPNDEFARIVQTYQLTIEPEIVGGILKKSRDALIRFSV